MSESIEQKPRLLIVEDDDDMRDQMRWALAANYEIYQASDAASAVQEQLRVHAPLVTLDLGLPPDVDGFEEGFKALEAILRLDPTTKILVITGKSDRAIALGAVERGATDFLSKPVDLEELDVLLRRCHRLHDLERQLHDRQTSPTGSFEGMLGVSERMRTVFNTIEQVASSSAPILILGESGTGKELIARAIHRRSPRRNGPFVAVNCAVFAAGLLESELFGHEKGAFTGAQAQRLGHFELAAGGTLFLDELGELPLATQVKLLRFLQELVVVRVGGREEIKVDTRLVAATHVDLKTAIAQGKFREDLYYRLAIVTIDVPALRDRRDDILPMAQVFLERALAAEGKPAKPFSSGSRAALESYPWPGNVRQLENHVRRGALMGNGPQITEEDLRLPSVAGSSATSAPATTTLRAAREATERELIRSTLEQNGGNISRSAKALGVSRPTLHDLIQKHSLKK